MRIEHICNVSAQEINLEDELTIDINPRNFSVASELESLTFICHTNLPTELISWEAKSAGGDVLELGFDGNLRSKFLITHRFQSSELSFPDGVSGIKAVSCWTNRAGQSGGASSFNMAQSKEDESCKGEIPTGAPTLTHPFSVESSTIVIAFGIMSILCLALLIVIACLLKRQCKKGSSEISVSYMAAANKYSPQPEDEPYYSASIEGNIVTHESLEKDQRYINVKDSGVNNPDKRSSTYEQFS
ncbi:hypothetical protein HOLleu_38856 [Holothuria leucospilota]|uniref:Uncharacterized protein n=1 Tax=Holothuria leucospilota TaxID=206669 RepID=A0A9Q1BBA6_HOLLE|nr:hypothetical protein HOLleu_38856 [Holothuria leucospilota]